MDPKENVILTEDGQRLTMNNGEVTGTDDSKLGLAYGTSESWDEGSDRPGVPDTESGCTTRTEDKNPGSGEAK